MKHSFIALLLISTIFSQQTVAVLDFEGIGVSQEEAKALSNRFGSEFLELAGYKFTLVERQAMGEILKEQGLQQTGCVSSECAVEVGAALGAQLIIIGSISKVGSIFSVNARMLDVETSRILKSINYDQVGDIGLLLTKGMREAAAKMLDVGVKPAAPLPPQTTSITITGLDDTRIFSNYIVGTKKIWNDKEMGTIKEGKLNLDELAAGTYTFTARKSGYAQNYKKVSIIDLSKGYNLDMTLEKLIPEVVFLNFRPRQVIRINNQPLSTYRLTENISVKQILIEEGKYPITIKEHGFEDIVDELDVKFSGQTFIIPNPIPIKVPVTFKLKPTYANVAINFTRDLITPWSYSDIIFKHGKPQNLIFGDYSFLATAPKYQSKNISVLVNKPKSQTFQINLEPKKRIKALTYSTLLPGSGQFYAENKTKSAIFFLASAGLSTMFYNNYDTYNVEEPLVSQYMENYLNATDLDEIDQNFNTYQSQVNTVNDLQTQMILYGGALAVTWIANLIDAYFFSGLLE